MCGVIVPSDSKAASAPPLCAMPVSRDRTLPPVCRHPEVMALVLLGRRLTPLCTARSVSATPFRCPIAQTCVSQPVGSHDRAMGRRVAPAGWSSGPPMRPACPPRPRSSPACPSQPERVHERLTPAGMPRRVFGRRSCPGRSASGWVVGEWSTDVRRPHWSSSSSSWPSWPRGRWPARGVALAAHGRAEAGGRRRAGLLDLRTPRAARL